MTAAVDNIGRRKWDLAKYKGAPAVADPDDPYGYAAGTDAADGKVVVREPLKRRNYEVDLWGQVGKYQVVSGNTALAQRGGFFCDVCDCLLKDSTTYLDHINGKKHQRRLGMSMKVERSTVEQVRHRLAMHKARKDGEQGEMGVEERMKRHEREMKRRKKQKAAADEESEEHEDKSDDNELPKEAHKDSDVEQSDGEKDEEQEEVDSEEANMAKLMGFGSFSASKVKQ